MVIPPGIGVSQPGQSRVKPLLYTHFKGDGPSTAASERERGDRGGEVERREAVIYSLYHGEFYGSDL